MPFPFEFKCARSGISRRQSRPCIILAKYNILFIQESFEICMSRNLINYKFLYKWEIQYLKETIILNYNEPRHSEVLNYLKQPPRERNSIIVLLMLGNHRHKFNMVWHVPMFTAKEEKNHSVYNEFTKEIKLSHSTT